MKKKKFLLLFLLLPLVSGCGTVYPPYYWPTIDLGIDEEFCDILAVYYVTPVGENVGKEKRAVEYYYSVSDYAISYIFETVEGLHYERIMENFHANNQNGELVLRFYNSELSESCWVYVYDKYAVTSELNEGEVYFTGNYAWINLYEFADEIRQASDTYFPYDVRETYYIDF